MRTKKTGGWLAVLLLLGVSVAAQAVNMDKISKEPLGERSVFSDRATNERLAPVGKVCVQGEECATATVAATPAATPAARTPMTAEQVFDKHCAMCHKTGAAGAPVFGDKGSWAPHIAKGEATLYHSAINGFQAMPPRGMCTECTDAELEATVRYMVNHSGGNFK